MHIKDKRKIMIWIGFPAMASILDEERSKEQSVVRYVGR